MDINSNTVPKIITDTKKENFEDRRSFLKKSILFTGTIITSKDLFGYSTPKEKVLKLNCFHLDEKYEIMFHDGYSYNLDSLYMIDKALRDHRENEIFNIDIRLVELLYGVQERIGRHKELKIVSGYRTPKTNRNLAKTRSGVAKDSYHMKGKAVDVCVPGVSTYKVKEAARTQKKGGVGYYPKSHFVHMDVGPVRQWKG